MSVRTYMLGFVMLMAFVAISGTHSFLGGNMSIQLTSDAFTQGGNIPALYTCKEKNISPPLKWAHVPENTQSFALICDDPDAPAGIWDHWLLYNIPGTTKSLPEHVPAQSRLPDGSLHGKNSWGRNDYGGPCPPSGKHRYYFKIYALNTLLKLPSGARKQELEHAMKGHVLSQGELMGYYQK